MLTEEICASWMRANWLIITGIMLSGLVVPHVAQRMRRAWHRGEEGLFHFYVVLSACLAFVVPHASQMIFGTAIACSEVSP